MVENNRNETHTSDPLLDTIKTELYAKVRPSEKLAAYIKGVLLNRQWTLEEFANRLGHQTTLFARALISGQMSEEVIDDDMIENLGRVIERNPNVIRVILGRKPQEGSQLDALINEQTEQSQEMIATLLAVLPNRYDSEVDDNNHKSKQYDFVIRQIERFIARQKRELEAAKRLVKQLQQDDPDESIKLDLRRIIHRIIADYPDAEIREAEVLLPKDKSTRTRKP
jgi:hypothetical protein